MLDLWKDNQAISARFALSEGTDLPSYFDLHQQQVVIAAAITIGVALLIGALLRLDILRAALVAGLACVVRSHRRIAIKLHQFWREVEDRI